MFNQLLYAVGCARGKNGMCPQLKWSVPLVVALSKLYKILLEYLAIPHRPQKKLHVFCSDGISSYSAFYTLVAV